MTTERQRIYTYRHDLKAVSRVIYICFTHSHTNVCLRIVIMGSSGDICNGNLIQIKGSNVIGFKIMHCGAAKLQ